MKPLLGSLLFSLFVPGTLFLLLPYLLVAAGHPLQPYLVSWTGYFGLLLAAIGVWVYLWAMSAFLIRGQGTPAPTAPPVHFVAVGPYRHVRNPMYLSGIIILSGEALIFRSAYLLLYMAVLFALFHAFVVLYEEPHLRQRFGAVYEKYLESVPRWILIKRRF